MPVRLFFSQVPKANPQSMVAIPLRVDQFDVRPGFTRTAARLRVRPRLATSSTDRNYAIDQAEEALTTSTR